MAVQLTAAEVDFLERIGRSPEGAFLLQILYRWQDDADRLCRRLEGPPVHVAQGHAQAWEKLINHLQPVMQSQRQPSIQPRRFVHAGNLEVAQQPRSPVNGSQPT